jgi:hypothetical protein
MQGEFYIKSTQYANGLSGKLYGFLKNGSERHWHTDGAQAEWTDASQFTSSLGSSREAAEKQVPHREDAKNTKKIKKVHCKCKSV